jgi:hypothetical protein
MPVKQGEIHRVKGVRDAVRTFHADLLLRSGRAHLLTQGMDWVIRCNGIFYAICPAAWAGIGFNFNE